MDSSEKRKIKERKRELKIGRTNFKNRKSVTVSTVSPSISHEVMGPDAMVFVLADFS